MTNTIALNELDMVTGGTIKETWQDGMELSHRGFMDELSIGAFIFDWINSSDKVDHAWARATKITCITKPFASNQYKIGTREITREEAYSRL